MQVDGLEDLGWVISALRSMFGTEGLLGTLLFSRQKIPHFNPNPESFQSITLEKKNRGAKRMTTRPWFEV